MKAFLLAATIGIFSTACSPTGVDSQVNADFVESYDKTLLDHFSQYAGRSFVFETLYPASLLSGYSGMVFDVVKGDILQESKGERACNIRVGNQFLHNGTNGGLDLPGGSGKLLNLCDLFYQYLTEFSLTANMDQSFSVPGDTSKVRFKTDSSGLVTFMETVGKNLGTVRIYSEGANSKKGFGPIIIK